MMNPFKIWRHHLANEAHRRYIAEHPTPRALRRARENKLGPIAGRRTSQEQWDAFVTCYLPMVLEDRAHKIRFASAMNDHARISYLREPITWQTIVAYVRAESLTALRPPKDWERTIHDRGLTGWSLVGNQTLVP